MSTYYYYSDTLYHHGIKGQKWGIRRYQNEDGSLTSEGRRHYGYGDKLRAKADYYDRKAELARTNFGKRRMVYKAEVNRGAANIRDIQAEAKRNNTKAKSVDLDIERAKSNKAFSERMAKTYKEGSRMNVAYKNSALADDRIQKLYEKQKAQNMSDGKRFIDNLKYDLSFKNDKLTWSGRETSFWKEVGIAMITNGVGNVALDELYYRRHNSPKAQKRNELKDAKKEYKEQDRKIQDDYYRKLEDLEKNYKRGQQLSAEDQEKERQYDREAQEAWANNKQSYKARVKSIKRR